MHIHAYTHKYKRDQLGILPSQLPFFTKPSTDLKEQNAEIILSELDTV